MKRIYTIILLITFSFSVPTKNDFNELFINVAEIGSHSVVSIVSEKIEKIDNLFFFSPFDPFLTHLEEIHTNKKERLKL